jgi:hypothetical protein
MARVRVPALRRLFRLVYSRGCRILPASGSWEGCGFRPSAAFSAWFILAGAASFPILPHWKGAGFGPACDLLAVRPRLVLLCHPERRTPRRRPEGSAFSAPSIPLLASAIPAVAVPLKSQISNLKCLSPSPILSPAHLRHSLIVVPPIFKSMNPAMKVQERPEHSTTRRRKLKRRAESLSLPNTKIGKDGASPKYQPRKNAGPAVSVSIGAFDI